MKKVNGNQSKILKYILDAGETAKAQIAQDLNLSMPTVLQITKTLQEEGLIKEVGTYESTGGRKAKALAVCENLRYAIGLDITRRHISLVLIDMVGNVVKSTYKRKLFTGDLAYCIDIKNEIDDFLKGTEIEPSKILGVGVSLPGIVDDANRMLLKSHALEMENRSLRDLENAIEYPAYFENDANAALMAEKTEENDSVIYLSLSNTVGGAMCIDGKLFRGNALRAGEIGHVALYPEGKTCYCGKKGCVDAYCSALVLRLDEDQTLEQFMEMVSAGDEKCVQIWDSYLEHLALTVANLRVLFDVDIILGGYVGHYLKDYMLELRTKISKISIFDSDVSYLRNCIFEKEVSAVGVAKHFIYKFVDELKID